MGAIGYIVKLVSTEGARIYRMDVATTRDTRPYTRRHVLRQVEIQDESMDVRRDTRSVTRARAAPSAEQNTNPGPHPHSTGYHRLDCIFNQLNYWMEEKQMNETNETNETDHEA